MKVWIFEWFKNLLKGKERVQSINQSPINQSISNTTQDIVVDDSNLPPIPTEATNSVELTRDYFQLGLAAGYTGRSLKAIENSLLRIETQMATKDWVNAQLAEKLQEIVDILRKHEENDQQRFEALKNMLSSKIPFSVNITSTPQNLVSLSSNPELTPRMRELIDIVKQNHEISYRDLAAALRITENGLRGLLSSVVKRTNLIQRFERDGKGWVRYTASLD